MIVLKRILVPTDFSETAARALEYAVSLAEAFGSALHILHVLEDPVPGWKPPGHVTQVPVIRQNMEHDASNQLARLETAAQRGELQVTTAQLWGSAFVDTIRYAKDNAIDLIVMGTHGHGPVAHMLLGSVAENVVRKAPCPVLTVHARRETAT